MNIYILALEGGGDLITKVVNEEGWNWIFGPSGRPEGETGWIDPFVPPAQMELIRAQHEEYAPPKSKRAPVQVHLTSGSWENDRAISAVTIPEYAEIEPYDEDAAAKIRKIAAKRGDAVIETWEGYIY